MRKFRVRNFHFLFRFVSSVGIVSVSDCKSEYIFWFQIKDCFESLSSFWTLRSRKSHLKTA